MAGKGKFKKNGMVIAHDEKHTGPEPTWDDAEFLSDEGLQDRMLDALRFYSYYLDRDDFSNFAMAWMVDAGYTPEDIKVIRSMPKEFSLSTSGKLCRMFSLGMPTSFNGKDHEEYVKNNIEMALERTRIHIAHTKLEEKLEEKENKPKPVPPMKRLETKVWENVIAHIDWALEEWCETKNIEAINVANLLGKANIPAKGCPFVLTWLESYLEDMKLAQSGEDKDCVEGYSFLTKRELNKWIKAFEKMKEDVEKYQKAHTKAVIRTKKVTPAIKQVGKLKFNKDDSKVSAMKIPGSVVTVLYNTKNRKLQIYYAIGRSGLSVKGTSIKDYDEDKSFQFTVRKGKNYEDVLASLGTLTNLKDVPKNKKPVNGRVNEHCAIVYVK